MAVVRVLAGFLAAVILAPATSWAQTWPNRPVRFIVPVVAGGYWELNIKAE